jgi:hypothetical protein
LTDFKIDVSLKEFFSYQNILGSGEPLTTQERVAFAATYLVTSVTVLIMSGAQAKSSISKEFHMRPETLCGI